jgi:hypothetical protein
MSIAEIKEVAHTKCTRCKCHRANDMYLNAKGRRLKTCSTCRSRFSCDKCDYKCSANGDLNKHKKAVHDKIKNFTCDKCDFKCSANGTLNNHKKAVHDKIRDFECDKCDYRCSANGDLNNHKKAVHDKIRDFECDKCDYKCSTNGDLNKHKKTCTGKLNISGGELACRKALELLNTKYETEYTFPDCKGETNKLLRFDFYIPEQNKLIEYDGHGHFKPVRFGGVSQERANENFKRRLRYDNIKNEYCEKNKIELLRIPYTCIDEVYYLIEEFIN